MSWFSKNEPYNPVSTAMFFIWFMPVTSSFMPPLHDRNARSIQ
jgi:hypothetical protein